MATREDLRPDPKPRKRPALYQWYQEWDEVTERKKRAEARLRSIQAGKSNMLEDISQAIISGDLSKVAVIDRNKVQLVSLERLQQIAALEMAEEGKKLGPVWSWLVSIKGIAGNLAAKVAALTDDIEKFGTISKYWRYAGHGCYKYWVDASGKVQAPLDGWKSRKGKKGEWTLYGELVPPETPFARPVKIVGGEAEQVRVFTIATPKDGWELVTLSDRDVPEWCSCQHKGLKSVVWQIGHSFILQGTEPYYPYYLEQKAKLRREHPERLKVNGRTRYNDGHIADMAARKMRKVFLQHLWVVWREAEGLPVSEPWIIAVGGHQGYIPPPNWPMEPSQA